MTTYLDIFWQLKFQCACPPNVVIWQTFKMNTICVITLFRVIEERVRERMWSCVNNRLIHQSHIASVLPVRTGATLDHCPVSTATPIRDEYSMQAWKHGKHRNHPEQHLQYIYDYYPIAIGCMLHANLYFPWTITSAERKKVECGVFCHRNTVIIRLSKACLQWARTGFNRSGMSHGGREASERTLARVHRHAPNIFAYECRFTRASLLLLHSRLSQIYSITCHTYVLLV